MSAMSLNNSMQRKIYRRLVEITIIATLLTAISMTVLYYNIYQNQVEKDLAMIGNTLVETEYFSLEDADDGADATSDTDSLTIPDFDDVDLRVEDLRITWIASDGTVLYDNDMSGETMENHLDRPEVKEALETGNGETMRDSDTMHQKNYYYAVRQDDGTVLRVAISASSLTNVFVRSLLITLAVLLIVVIICILIARLLTSQVIAPIKNTVENLDDTSRDPEYKELVPLVNTIRSQHENILLSAKARQDFTANVSHELKTPLTAISGYAELIETGMVDGDQTVHFAEEIHKNSNRLLDVINDIIRLSEIDGRDVDIVFEEVDLDTVIQSCMGELGVAASRRNVTLEYDGVPCTLRANPTMLRELVENLCQNAIRYNNPGGHVWVTVRKEGGNGVLVVKDDGIGIPKDQQERVFERFYRVDKSRSKQTGGTGLGLAIVKHIVDLHDAKLTMDSDLGKGTEIKIEF